MKKYLFLFLILTAFSCKSYREFLEREHYNVLNAKDTIVDKQYIYGYINDKKAKFLFDTGATSSVIQNLDLIGGKDILNTEDSKKLINATSADGSEFSLYKVKTLSFETNTYKSKNRYIITFNKERMRSECIKEFDIGYDGILGLDAFINSETPLFLDYENNQVKILNELPDLEDFVELDAEIKSRRIMLNSEINGHKTQLLFDTGNNNYMVISKNLFTEEEADFVYESGMFTANSTLSFPLTKIYTNRNINIGSLLSSNNQINVIESFKTNGVGIQFINKYNWIIDFKEKKVYAKKIKDFEVSNLIKSISNISYKALELEGHLIIFHKSDPQNTYNAGYEIVSVDDDEVTEENICEILSLLNSTNDWSQFKIETKPRE